MGSESSAALTFGRAERLEHYWPQGAKLSFPAALLQSHGYPRAAAQSVSLDPSPSKAPKEEDSSSLPSSFSTTSVLFPFSSDLSLRGDYASPWKTQIRMGKILEDLDMLAALTAWTHSFSRPVLNFSSPAPKFGLVTASIDRICCAYERISMEKDLNMSASVSWVGRSSLEVHCQVTSGDQKVIQAYFVMAARDHASGKPVTVPVLQDPCPQGQQRALRRKQERESSLKSTPPTAEESRLLHQIHLVSTSLESSFEKIPSSTLTLTSTSTSPSSSPFFPNWKPMSSSRFQTTTISHIQDQNINNSIYGGTLVRKGLDIAFIAAAIYTKSTPRFFQLHELHFLRPVPVGSILSLDAIVNYVNLEKKLVSVRVMARVIDKVTAPEDQKLTTTFQFTFRVKDVPDPVLPQSYDEMMLYLEGYRADQSS